MMPRRSLPTILLVDDDVSVLDALNELFIDRYNTILARSGAEAIEAVTARSNVRAIVLDIKMASMNGVETYRAIKNVRPHLPIIIHTGTLSDNAAALIRALEPFACLQKGKSILDLVRAVETACEQAGSQTSAPPTSKRSAE